MSGNLQLGDLLREQVYDLNIAKTFSYSPQTFLSRPWLWTPLNVLSLSHNSTTEPPETSALVAGRS